ncbi:DUF992 domain-containing protein [Aquabacter spiritensis]|uniref:Uncharacterized protein DUF992 n=1 Tax=Aquabacter spiritensis TaxID=933073 RepID=A0A4R3LTG9_9HYPH|nr:DUF992 domain-containing protein [Aquabacter spiritensis]TCT03186.1 uncharacterized protein DUF992 [Aquabacter spiritensis]
MKMFAKAGLAAAIAASALTLGALPAAAQSRVQVGTLVCNMKPNVAFIIGSVREATCTLKPATRRTAAGSYAATIRRFGLDIGMNGTGVMVWTVLAPTRSINPTDLRGTYVGVSAGAAIGVGVGANALVGGSNNTIALQPVSVQGETGINLALGVADLTLR